MITEADIKWLEEYRPSLKANDDHTEIRGSLEFTAAYDRISDKFTWLFEADQTALGEVLSGTYKIVIKKEKSADELPTLLLEDENIQRTSARHFYKSGRACLCGLAEEVDFMSRYSFLEYLDKYVVQFLYGQKFYDKYEKWPWRALAHGATGIFQSYGNSARTPAHLRTCIRRLKINEDCWKQIRPILSGSVKVIESRNCFCGRNKNIKSCHMDALYGLLKLRADVQKSGIALGQKIKPSH